MKKVEKKITQVIDFNEDEWNFIQVYKNKNKLQNEQYVIKLLIQKEIERNNNIIISSINKHTTILKQLADK